MTTTKAAVRRAAMHAAREAMAARVTAVGDLSEQAAARQACRDAVATARGRAEEMVQAARDAGRALVDRARDDVTQADERYAAAHAGAVEAGWSVGELRSMGLPPPPRRRASQGDAPSSTPASSAAPALALAADKGAAA